MYVRVWVWGSSEYWFWCRVVYKAASGCCTRKSQPGGFCNNFPKGVSTSRSRARWRVRVLLLCDWGVPSSPTRFRMASNAQADTAEPHRCRNSLSLGRLASLVIGVARRVSGRHALSRGGMQACACDDHSKRRIQIQRMITQNV